MQVKLAAKSVVVSDKQKTEDLKFCAWKNFAAPVKEHKHWLLCTSFD